MSKKRNGIYVIVVCVALNLAGRALAEYVSLPCFMNLTGTIAVGYFIGPFSAIMTAVVSCGISSLFSHMDLYYIIADVIVGLSAGVSAQKGSRFLEKFTSAITLVTFFSIVRGVTVFGSNIFFFGGATPFELPNAVIDYLVNMNVAPAAAYFTAAMYISFADSFTPVILVYLFFRVKKFIYKKHKSRMLKRALGGKITLGVIAFGLVLTSVKTFPTYAYSQINFVQRLYNSDDGLVGGCLNDIVQTEDGTMWVGTYGGLYRFNGSQFELITDIDSVRSVHSLYVDDEDRLWIGTNDAGVTVARIDTSYSVMDTESGLPSDTVKDIVQDSEGIYYFATSGGLVMADYEDDSIVIKKVYAELGNVINLDSDSKGRVVALNLAGEIWVLDGGEILSQTDCGNEYPTCVDYDNKGNLYIGCSSGMIYKYKTTDSGYKRTKKSYATEFSQINDIFFNTSGYIFLASDTGIGYIDLNDNVNTIISPEFDNSIDVIYKDYQANIWFTSSRCGLLALSNSSFSDLFSLCNAAPDVSNGVVRWNNLLYVGTDSGLVIMDDDNGKSLSNSLTEYLAGTRVRCVFKTEDDTLLISTFGKGVIEVFKDGSFSPYPSPKDNSCDRVRFAIGISEGEVVISGEDGLVFVKDHEVIKRLRPGKELSNATVLNAMEASQGTIYAGTDGDGIAIIKDMQLERYITKEDGLPSGVILRIVKDTKGDGYFILTGSGLCYMDGDNTISEIDVPYYNNYDLWISDEGEVFIIGGAGIYIINYNILMSGDGLQNYVLLNEKTGLPGSITSNAWNYISAENILYLCGTSGVYALNLENYDMYVDSYKTKITHIKTDGTDWDVTDMSPLYIDKGVDKVELTIEINNFTTAVPYIRYYMSGVDTEKTTIQSDKIESIVYYNLPYGEHDFHIEVVSEDGSVLSDRIYTVIKEKEVYETAGFRVYFFLLMALFFTTIIISMVQGSVLSLTKKQKNSHQRLISRLEREKAEALERALHSEEEANKTKSAFLANMTHEIRTPINAIIGMDTMIMRETKEPEIKNYAIDIHNASKTLLSLINDILDFSKIESGNLELVPGEYDLSLLISNLINMVKPKLGSKNIEFKVNVNPDIPRRLYGDELRISQAVLNILNNAVKYTEEGSVTFSVDYEALETEEILLIISVTDTGIGIKEEDIEKLFSPYKRIDEQRNRGIEGTGLGMSITKNLLDMMGSQLEVRSVYGEGSTFSFAIVQSVKSPEKMGDFTGNAMAREAGTIKAEAYHAPGASVLVVDDVEMNLTVIKNLLKRIQVDTDITTSGREAVKMAKVKPYDIILLDSMMPEMSGEETMKEIRDTCELNAQTPVIVLTAHTTGGAREEYLRLGYTNYLAKPIDGAKLEAMLQSYLPDEKIILTCEAVEDGGDNVQDVPVERDSVLPPTAESGVGEDVYKVIEQFNRLME